ncbi:MAG: helix-turn-helix transcriptional regulator [Thermodesulfobacteriota bacterium]
MNAPISNAVVLEKDGHPAFVVLPFEEYRRLVEREMAAEGCLPHEVVGKHVLENKPLVLAWREYLGLSVEEVAKRLNVTPATVSDLESSDRRLTPARRKKLAAALGIRPEQLSG